MILNSLSTKILYSFFTLLFLLFSVVTLENDASAGVLFGNRRQVIRTQTPGFRQLNYQVRTSSMVLRSTNPNLRASNFGGVSDQMRLIKTRYKYDVAVAKWDQKRQQQLAKQQKKQKDLAAREAKRKQREAERLKRQREKDESKINSSFGSTLASSSSISSNSSSRGSLGMGSSQTNQNGKKKGFWASLYEAIFAKKAN